MGAINRKVIRVKRLKTMPYGDLSTKELMLLNCGAGGLLNVPWTARRSNQSILKEINPEYSSEGLLLKPKLQYSGHWCKELTLWKRPWYWERLKEGEGDDRGWDGWMASLTGWTWVWVNSRRWWWTGRPYVLRFMGSQRVGHNWETELNWPHRMSLKIYLPLQFSGRVWVG